MWNVWFIITFLTLPEMINLSSWLLSPSWTPLLFTSSPLARISWASGGMPVTSRLARTAWNRGEQRSKILDNWMMALYRLDNYGNYGEWKSLNNSLTWNVGPFWDDSPYKNHDSRARFGRDEIYPDWCTPPGSLFFGIFLGGTWLDPFLSSHRWPSGWRSASPWRGLHGWTGSRRTIGQVDWPKTCLRGRPGRKENLMGTARKNCMICFRWNVML